MKKLFRFLFFIGSLLFLVANGQEEMRPTCQACAAKCSFNPVCLAAKAYCWFLASLTSTVIFVAFNSPCRGDPINYEGREAVAAANDLLVERNIFTRDFVNGVEVLFCTKLDRWAAGMTPSGDMFWVDDYMLDSSVESLASLMAHEYVHILQWRRLGTGGFKCEYGLESISQGGTNPANNRLEVEAYAFQNSLYSCIYSDLDCPPAP